MRRGVVDRDIHPADRVREGLDGEVEVSFGGANDEAELIEELDGVDVLITTSRLPVSRRVLEATDLEVVGKIGTGLDNVALDAASRLGVPVTYTPGVNALAVAEHTVGMIVAVSRRFGELESAVRAGGWRDEVELGSQVYGKTVGIVGFGNIGSRVAGMLDGFHVDVLAHDPYIEDIDTDVTGADLVALDELLDRADVVSINAELTRETRGMIGAEALDAMKPGAVLVNTARGPIVDQGALIDALRSGHLGGAGLDVFETEPPAEDSPLFDLENVIVTPHAAGLSVESRARTIDRITENVVDLLDGRAVPDRFMAARPER